MGKISSKKFTRNYRYFKSVKDRIAWGDYKKREFSKSFIKEKTGLSISQLKTALKRKGILVPKNMFHPFGYYYSKVRLYRIRFDDDDNNFVIDIGEPKNKFDRWANSTEYRMPLLDFLKKDTKLFDESLVVGWD